MTENAPQTKNQGNILNQWLRTEMPIIMAPMFLVTNNEMMIAADKAGISGCIPALNYRTPELLREGLREIKSKTSRAFGVNLIVNKSNIYYKEQLKILCEEKVDYVITSLGSPEETIKSCKPAGVKVFCDVVDVKYAQKVEALGADAVIAVNNGAGGHAGKIPATVLVPMLREHIKIPVISAGGVGTGRGLLAMEVLGACGISMGSPFIATTEGSISKEYKQACVDYGAEDIVMTSRISGTPCTVINTPYVQKIGTDQNPVEKLLNTNKKLKKYAKMLTYWKGMKAVEKAAFAATYKTVWCAGPSIEFSDKLESVGDIVTRLKSEYEEAKKCFA